MKSRVAFLGLFVAMAASFGCGGASSLGRNSDIVVNLIRTDGTQVMTQFEVFVTKDADTGLNQGDPEDFISTANEPSWADQYSATRNATQLTLNYRTRSDQTPYYVFVKVPNTGANFETLKLRIDIDGVQGPDRTFDLDINRTSRLAGVRINRNDAVY